MLHLPARVCVEPSLKAQPLTKSCWKRGWQPRAREPLGDPQGPLCNTEAFPFQGPQSRAPRPDGWHRGTRHARRQAHAESSMQSGLAGTCVGTCAGTCVDMHTHVLATSAVQTLWRGSQERRTQGRSSLLDSVFKLAYQDPRKHQRPALWHSSERPALWHSPEAPQTVLRQGRALSSRVSLFCEQASFSV